jgi:hypothetical protein
MGSREVADLGCDFGDSLVLAVTVDIANDVRLCLAHLGARYERLARGKLVDTDCVAHAKQVSIIPEESAFRGWGHHLAIRFW